MTLKGIIGLLGGHRPFGLFCWRYIRLGNDRELELHRRMFFSPPPCRSRILWALLQFWLVVKWRLLRARKAARGYVSHYGPVVEKLEGISVADQKKTVTRLCVKYCMDPGEIYLYRLYGNPETALDYVHASENGAFHHIMNRDSSPDQANLLQDKLEFGTKMRELGVPTVETLRLVREGAPFDPAAIRSAPGSRVFCKRRDGFRAIGAMAVWETDRGFAGETLSGQPLEDQGAVRQAWENLARGNEFLVQPLLTSHPLFVPVRVESQPVVIRLVTQKLPEGSRTVAAYLRIPTRVPANQSGKRIRNFHFPIETGAGTFKQPQRSMNTLDPPMQVLENIMYERLKGDAPLPFWSDVLVASAIVQNTFDTLWSLGLDWVLTEDGPRLLEGNVVWSVTKPQLLGGRGILKMAL